jgi:vacuolar protein sorting-associated protein 13A/C
LFDSVKRIVKLIWNLSFRLGYFEIKSSAYTWKELSSQATVHYKNQIIKQAYILLLGLDVLGNPVRILYFIT